MKTSISATINLDALLRDMDPVMPINLAIGPKIVVTAIWSKEPEKGIEAGIEAAEHGSVLQGFHTTNVRTRIRPEDIPHLKKLADGEIESYRPGGKDGSIEFFFVNGRIQVSRWYNLGDVLGFEEKSIQNSIRAYDFEHSIVESLEMLFEAIGSQ